MEAGSTWIANVRTQAPAREVAEPVEREGRSVAEPDYVERNRAAWERWAPTYAPLAGDAWNDELRWGIWGVHEDELGLLSSLRHGANAVELGCGTGAVSAGLARRGLHPVAVDFAAGQLRTVERNQIRYGLTFELLHANAESIPYDDGSFELAVSDYGTSLWSDPSRWVPEAHRLLRDDGRLLFITNSPLLMACTPVEGGPAKDRLVREHATNRVEFPDDDVVEFHLTHGEWVRLLRATGFVIDDLVEVKPPPLARSRFDFVSAEWARRWPSEDIWVARKSA